MKGKRFDFFSFSIAVINIAAASIAVRHLPIKIPMHFNIYGQVDRIAGREEFFYFSFVPLLMFLIFYLLTFTDKRLNGNFKPFWVICRGAILLLIAVQYSMLLSLNSNSLRSVLLVEAIGAAIVLMGIYIPKLKQNTVAGFRLPWTLKDEDNWKATHRFGGQLSIIIGFLLIISGLIFPTKYSIILIFVLITLWTIIIIFYSYIYYKKNNG